jgi:eukaryotic-like serine/threonine-protein kinase
MLTGRVPFVSDTEFGLMMAQIEQAPPPPTAFAPHIPLPIEGAIMRSLAKKPEARFQTVTEFREVLEQSLGGVPATVTVKPVAAPPATRIAMPATPTGGDAPKETRLGGAGAAAAPGQFYPQGMPGTPSGPHPGFQPAHAQRPPAKNSKVGVYIAVGAVLLVIVIAAPVLIFLGMKGGNPPAPAVVSEPTPVPQAPGAMAPSAPAPAAVLPPAAPGSAQPSTGLIDAPISTESPRAETSKPSRAAKQPKKKDDDMARKREEARRLLEQ